MARKFKFCCFDLFKGFFGHLTAVTNTITTVTISSKISFHETSRVTNSLTTNRITNVSLETTMLFQEVNSSAYIVNY